MACLFALLLRCSSGNIFHSQRSALNKAQNSAPYFGMFYSDSAPNCPEKTTRFDLISQSVLYKTDPPNHLIILRVSEVISKFNLKQSFDLLTQRRSWVKRVI